MSRYDQFAKAYRNLDLLPLDTADKIERFRVPYAQRTLLELEEAVLAPVDNSKTIFTGHRGCGKSTLLAQLAMQMREQNLFVAGFSIANMVEMSDVNHINILYSIGLQLMDKAEELNVPIEESVKNSLIQWFTQTKSKTYTEQLKQEFSVGAS
ncbi:MAG: KAP family P-loop domain protein, partial [Phormidesmis priestleyi]